MRVCHCHYMQKICEINKFKLKKVLCQLQIQYRVQQCFKTSMPYSIFKEFLTNLSSAQVVLMRMNAAGTNTWYYPLIIESQCVFLCKKAQVVFSNRNIV